MTCFSMGTNILGISVSHCQFSPGDDHEEHYCVDANGFLALHNFLTENEDDYVKDIAEVEGAMLYHKIPIFYNPNLDGGSDGSAGTNADNCEAKEALP